MSNTSMFLYPKQAASFIGVGTTKFYQLNKLPDFPKPKNPCGRRPMYLRSDLAKWANNLD